MLFAGWFGDGLWGVAAFVLQESAQSQSDDVGLLEPGFFDEAIDDAACLWVDAKRDGFFDLLHWYFLSSLNVAQCATFVKNKMWPSHGSRNRCVLWLTFGVTEVDIKWWNEFVTAFDAN